MIFIPEISPISFFFYKNNDDNGYTQVIQSKCKNLRKSHISPQKFYITHLNVLNWKTIIYQNANNN